MVRAMVVNAAQLGTYSQAKQFLLGLGKETLSSLTPLTLSWFTYTDSFSDNIICHFCASMISGLVTTVASMPVDIAKTRYII